MKHRTLYTALAMLIAVSAFATDCLEDGGVFRSSLNCTGLPTIPKFFEVSTFSWGGTDYLALNTGNELSLYRLTDLHPETASFFRVGNQGDSDYDLLNYSFCDGCRYGVATYKMGTVLFDLGMGTAPRFVAKTFHGTSSDPRGAFTFEHGGSQYLLANYLPGDCGGDATLYRFGGLEDLEPIGCLDVPGFSGKFLNGAQLGEYLYLGFYDNRLRVYRVQGTGGGLTLSHTGHDGLRAYMGRGKGFAVDSGLAVTSFVGDGLHVWDVSDPGAPVELGFVPGDFGLAALGGRFAWVAHPLTPDSSRTFYLGDPSHPVELDPGFWAPSHPWNHHSTGDLCEWPTSAVFNGSTMYLARYNVAQAIDFSGCPPPVFADGFDSGATAAWSAVVP